MSRKYTVRIEAAGMDGDKWQALEPAENVTMSTDATADVVAALAAANQTVATGEGWRVRVWLGHDADTATEPAAEYSP